MSKAVRKLNYELECERRGRKIVSNLILITSVITIIGPFTLLVLLNADWVDHFFLNPFIQLAFLIFMSFVGGLLYLKWKLR